MASTIGGVIRKPLILLVVLCTAAFAAASAIGSDNPMLDAVNAQRAANGIPIVAWNTDWAAKCKIHNAFEQANNVFGHAEDPSLPGSSDEGNWAGTHSILAGGGLYTAAPRPGEWATPFEWAPIHLIQMLAPAISVMGGAQIGANGLSCLTTWPGFTWTTATDTPTFYSYPGNATTGIYGLEQASEAPTTPEAELGLPRTTGPNIFVYAEGFDSDTVVASATLVDDRGHPTELAWWDAGLSSLRGYSPAGSVTLIPKRPLVGHTHYTISTTLTDPRPAEQGYVWNATTRNYDLAVTRAAYTATASHTFGFTTGACDACRHLPGRPVGVLALRRAPSAAAFIISSNGQSTGRFTVSRLGKGVRYGHSCRTASATARQRRGRSVCAAWIPLGRFTEDEQFGDGDTTCSLRSLLGRTGPSASRYRITVGVLGGGHKTIEIVA
jgi:hypothetical protein